MLYEVNNTKGLSAFTYEIRNLQSTITIIKSDMILGINYCYIHNGVQQ